MQSLLRIAGTVAIRFGMATIFALSAPAMAATGDETRDEDTTSHAATTSDRGGSTAMASSGSVTDFLTFDAEPDSGSTSGNRSAPSGSAAVSTSVHEESNVSKDERGSGDEQ